MAYALKTTGVIAGYTVKAALVVDDTGAAVQDLVSGNTISTHANVTFGSATYLGTSRNYFTVGGTGSTPWDVTWTGTRPSLVTATASVGTTFILVINGIGAGMSAENLRPVITAEGASSGIRVRLKNTSGTNKPTVGTGSITITTATTDNLGDVQSAYAFYTVRGGTNGIRQRTAAGTFSTQESATDSGFVIPNDTTLRSLGSTTTTWGELEVFAFLVVDGTVSSTDADAIVDDWFGSLIDVPAAPTFSGTIPTLTGSQGAAFAAQSPTIASYFTGAGITYSVSAALPSGLSIDGSTGVISGTPSTDTDWSGYVTATNGGGSDDSNTFAITISPPVADLSSPTVTSVGATTATCGFSTDTASGNGYFLRRTSLSAASSATIISTGESQAISGTGAQTRAMTGFTSGLTYYVDMAQTGSTEVVTAGPFYPGTGRPVSDVDVTGWTASTGSDLWAMLDEDTASDSDYVTSPALSGSATTGSHALDKTYTAGTYSIKVRAKTDTGAGTLAVRLLNGSNVSQGVTADQAITSTWTTYTLAITTTGDATRIRYEVVAA